MRLSLDTGKTDCHIIDFVDSSNRVSGVVCTPTLFGLEPGEIDIHGESPTTRRLRLVQLIACPLTDETTESLEKRTSEIITLESRSNIPSPKSVTYIDHENPFSFVRQSSGAPHVTALSRNAWVGCGEDIYVLECLGKGHIRVEPVSQDEGKSTRVPRASAVLGSQENKLPKGTTAHSSLQPTWTKERLQPSNCPRLGEVGIFSPPRP